MTAATDPYLQFLREGTTTPQHERARHDQVQNRAGGYVFSVDRWAQLHRFLTIGSSGGTFHAGESELTQESVSLIRTLLAEDGRRVVRAIRDVNEAGRAPRVQPQLFALALAASYGLHSTVVVHPDESVRDAALAALPAVCRTATQLFTFIGYVQRLRGWGPVLAHAVANWYELKSLDRLAYQGLKYRQREGWTHRDVLRLSHPEPHSYAQDALFGYLAGHGTAKFAALDDDQREQRAVHLVEAYERVQTETSVDGWVDVVMGGVGLSWEMLPDAALNEPRVWRALLDVDAVPQTALLRQLPRLTRLGLLLPGGELTELVTDRLTDGERLRAGRLHPVNVLAALRTYTSGQSARGSSSWSPVTQIVDALDAAFYRSLGTLEPAGKRTLLALDVSGSMDMNNCGGTVLTPREVSTAMAMATVASEPATTVVAFSDGMTGSGYRSWSQVRSQRVEAELTVLPLSARQRLDDVLRNTSELRFGATDCALPARWATEQRLDFDTVVIYTDSETWYGDVHPFQALEQYRRQVGHPVRQVVVALTGTAHTIADPHDGDSLDVSGFDSAVPQLVADFGRGDL